MKNISINVWQNHGSSLIETVIAMAVLAVAIPLVFGALAQSGKSTLSSEAETHGTWIIPACMEEVQASRRGCSQFFPATEVNEQFPPKGEVWALGFSREGQAVATLPKSMYERGTKEVAGKSILYIATLNTEKASPSATEIETSPHTTPLLRVEISLEFPATSPATKRQKLKFFTCMP